MEASILSPSQARLKLTILNKQAEAKNNYEFYAEMKDLRLPDEIIAILEKIWKVTSKMAGKIISIGKIIAVKLIEYVVQNPLQVAGLAAGLYTTYTLGVALHGLFTLVPTLAKLPLIGGLLSKLALLVASLCKTIFVPFLVALPFAGAAIGGIADKKYPEISESLHKLVTGFFELFGQIIESIKDEFDFEDISGQAFV